MRYRLLAFLCVALGLGMTVHTFFYTDAWVKRNHVQSDVDALKNDNAGAQARVERLRGQVLALKTRPEVQERVVRHALGYVRPGELVLNLDN